MGKLKKVSRFFASKIVAAGILGFLLGLFSEVMILFVPAGMELEFAILLLFPILILMIHVLGFLDEAMKQLRKWRRFRSPIIIGVLKGYLDDSKKGIECEPMYTAKKDWADHFRRITLHNKNLFLVKDIFWSEISSKYAAIINPFGEVYLESDKRSFLIYEKIKEFVANGGIFCCTGGFPFYYYWDEITGRPVDTTPKTRLSRRSRIQDVRFFNDSLVTRDFGAIINNDPLTPSPIKVYQEKKLDIEFFGELSNIGGTNEVLEFRSLSEGSRGLIPGLRAKHKDEEKYLLAAISYGDGYLILAGMHVKTDVEFRKVRNGIANFVIEIAKRHKTRN